MTKQLLYPFLSLLPLMGAAQGFHEGFTDITLLEGNGWTLTNQSNPAGDASWFQGNSSVFAAHGGAGTAYIAANFQSTSGAGDISNWLITPAVNVVDGDILAFWTRTTAGTQWNDRLEVRSSTGTMTLPANSDDVGSFTTLHLVVNDDYDLSYPETWTRFEVVVSGVGSTPAPINFALRYNVLNGGPDGTDSNYIGIDDLFIGNPDDEDEGTEPVELCTPALDCTDGDLILNVTFAGIDNSTDCSPNGYGDFTAMMATVAAGQSYPISVTVGDGWSSESVSVWVDWSGNDQFEEGEFTYIATGTAETLDGTINIPADVVPGDYLMRVRVAAVTNVGATWDMACDDAQGFGETEDYTISVGSVGIHPEAPIAFSFVPNPVNDVLNISTDGKVVLVEAFNMTGQQVLSIAQPGGRPINVSGLIGGVYVFRVVMDNGQVITFKATKD